MKKQNNKSNITVFVGRSEQSDLRHLYLFVGWSEQSDLRHLYLFVGRSEQSDLRQISKKGYQNYFFFNQKKPMKTTRKPRWKLTLDQFYQKLPLCQKKLPYGNLIRRNIPMKFNDIHKQFAVKSFAKMMTRSETQGKSREEKDQKGANKKSEIRVTFLILTEFFKSQVTCKRSHFLAHTDKQCNGRLTDIGFASLYPTNKRL